MKKILIIGSTEFIGSYLYKHLSSKFEVVCIEKINVNIFDTKQVTKFLSLEKPNIVINCLTLDDNSIVDTEYINFVGQNFAMFYNFYLNSCYFDMYINIGSGAEFDTSKDIHFAKEKDIFIKKPLDPYGFYKNLISKHIWKDNKFTTLRLFGCFGSHELEHKLLKTYTNSSIPIELTNRFFDYFSIQDFFNVVYFVIENNIRSVDINCVYKNKILISDFLDLYDNLNNKNTNYVITTFDKNYTGDSSFLDSFGVKLNGLEHGLKEYNV